MSEGINPFKLEIYRNLFASIAEEMDTVLRRRAYSPNVKERLDYSCAVFDGLGQLIAMGDHMPVHLGSMPLSMDAALDSLTVGPEDVVILNDSFSGGTHLPDITLIAPVFKPSDPFYQGCFPRCLSSPSFRYWRHVTWFYALEPGNFPGRYPDSTSQALPFWKTQPRLGAFSSLQCADSRGMKRGSGCTGRIAESGSATTVGLGGKERSGRA